MDTDDLPSANVQLIGKRRYESAPHLGADCRHAHKRRGARTKWHRSDTCHARHQRRRETGSDSGRRRRDRIHGSRGCVEHTVNGGRRVIIHATRNGWDTSSDDGGRRRRINTGCWWAIGAHGCGRGGIHVGYWRKRGSVRGSVSIIIHTRCGCGAARRQRRDVRINRLAIYHLLISSTVGLRPTCVVSRSLPFTINRSRVVRRWGICHFPVPSTVIWCLSSLALVSTVYLICVCRAQIRVSNPLLRVFRLNPSWGGR